VTTRGTLTGSWLLPTIPDWISQHACIFDT